MSTIEQQDKADAEGYGTVSGRPGRGKRRLISPVAETPRTSTAIFAVLLATALAIVMGGVIGSRLEEHRNRVAIIERR